MLTADKLWRRSTELALPIIALVVATWGVVEPALAQAPWPSQRITIVVPVAAGTVTDAVARILADQLKDALGQPVVVEDRAGAAGTLGARLVARATPDGYTFLLGGNTTHSVIPSTFKSPPYDPVADFTPIARLCVFTTFLATNPQQPFKSAAEMVAFAKANPGKLTYGHGNATGQIIGETIRKRLGADIVRLPYANNVTATTDLMSNNIQLMVPDLLIGVPLVEAGKMVALAVATASRNSRLPATPTLAETILPGFELSPWAGLFGPPGLPPAITERLSGTIERLMADTVFVEKLRATGPEPYFMAAQPFAAFVAADVPVWSGHTRMAGIEPQ